MDFEAVKSLLETKTLEYNRTNFIAGDPVSIPHLFTRKQDREIMGLLAAVLAWGRRDTIIRKCHELVNLMDGEPYKFVRHHTEEDLKPLLKFRHRTFNDIDVLYFIRFFHEYYAVNESLERAFTRFMTDNSATIKSGLKGFHHLFFSLDEYPQRTRKHIATPEKQSACKRLNMFLRWMARCDERGVDFGIWQNIRSSQLICPCDIHVGRVARKLGLLTRKQSDWKAACELTDNLRRMDPDDPVKYDFALFGLGVVEKY